MSATWGPYSPQPSQTAKAPPPSSRRYIIYDREQVWSGGNQSTRFFNNNRQTWDGRPKDLSFTNMICGASLGYPYSMEVVAISLYPVEGDEEYLSRYDRFTKSYSVFKFILGQNEVFTTVPLALMSVRSMEERIYRDRITNEMCYVAVEDGKLVVNKYKPLAEAPLEGLFADRGAPRFVNVLTSDKRPRFINSTMMFNAEIEDHPPADAKPLDLYCCLEGLLHFGMMP
jgi:hypothetical protein